MPLHGANIVAGKPSKDGSTRFQVFDPASQNALEPLFHEATSSEVDAALEAATAAFQIYRHKSRDDIAALLEAIAAEILGLGGELLQRVHAETALPDARLQGERSRAVDQLRLFARTVREGSWVDARIDLANAGRKPAPKPDTRRMLMPIGPVVVFGASNFPLAISLAGSDTVAALAAGNPVVAKAHPSHPGTSELLATAIASAIEKTRMPAGLFSMLHGQTPGPGLALARHPHTRAIAFTGSFKAGRALFEAAHSRPVPIPCYSEMGSVNPVFVLPDAVRTKGAEIARSFVQSLTLGVGQFCTNPGLLVGVAGPDLNTFIDETRKIAAQTPSAVMLNSGICENYWRGVERMRGNRNVEASAGPQDRSRATPVVFATDDQTFLKCPELAEEIFGPATLIVRCESAAALMRIANTLPGQLTMTLQGTEQDLSDFQALIDIMTDRAGRLIVNGFPTGVEVCASMHHGGPYPATTDAKATSIGTAAMLRFVRPVCFQDFPQRLLPPELQDKNERKIWRLIENEWTKADAGRTPASW